MALRERPRPGLGEAAVIRAAAALVDAEGVNALTLSRLAARLGVRIPSLYNHVAGLEDVRRGVALLGMRELTAALTRGAVGRAGEDGVVALAEAYRLFAHERPGLYDATLRAPDPTDSLLQEASGELMAVVRAVLTPYGLHGVNETHALRAFRSLVHGFVSLERVRGFGLPVDLDESFHHLVHLFIIGLRAEGAADESARAAQTQEGTIQ